MPSIIVINRSGQERVVEAAAGNTVMEIIRDAGFSELLAICGGCCSCATCHVHVDPIFANLVTPLNSDENDLLEGSAHRDERSRLACQIRFDASMDGLRVTIAQED